MSGAHILLVDDDPAILRAVRRALEAQGFAVRSAGTGKEALAAFREFRPDVILLDLLLPDGDGIDICRRIRDEATTPVIVLSAVGDDQRKVLALDSGADDYITKPFSIEELQARIRVALRHAARSPIEPAVVAGPIRIDLASRTVTVEGAEVRLTPREYDLLRLLAEHDGRVLTQRYILSRVWGPAYGEEGHILRTFVHQLRAKLGPAGRLIVTDPGVGYRLATAQA